jgi:hypothetical protein
MNEFFKKQLRNTVSLQAHFRMAYTLMPAIRRLIEHAKMDKESMNIVGIACGVAMELVCFEQISRSTGKQFNYTGFDINLSDLRFNNNVLRKKCSCVMQRYEHRNLASNPPKQSIVESDCILWRHPEFLSDDDETDQRLIFNLSQILWHVLQNKNQSSVLMISSYDPQEMMFFIELLKQFCTEDLQYSLSIDRQPGRASMANPLIVPQDEDPVFNLNHHDQCLLLVEESTIKQTEVNEAFFINALSQAFKNIFNRHPIADQLLLKQLDDADLMTLKKASFALNNLVRQQAFPIAAREALLSSLSEDYGQNDELDNSVIAKL